MENYEEVPAGPKLREKKTGYLGKLGQDFKKVDGPLGLATALESLLKHPAQLVYEVSGGMRKWMPYLILTVIVGALFYGFIMGTYSGGTQLWASPVKVAFGLIVSALLTFPSLYVFTCVNGSDLKIGPVFSLLVLALGLVVLLLAGFAPVLWIFSQTTTNIVFIGWIHLIFWLISLGFGYRLLSAGFGLLGKAYSGGLAFWAFVFLLVSFQMSTILRPILGTSKVFLADEKLFFLTHWFSCMGD
jgi:hypothetical protein